MKPVIILTLAMFGTGTLDAFPPAPFHEVYGLVRDERGSPLSGNASVTLSGDSGKILSGLIDPLLAPGVNYSLKVPMDAGTLSQLYQSTAMRPSMPFTASVSIAGVNYVPIEVQGGALAIGDPGGRTRLDLTLGIDSDGDGLPDSWEQEIIDRVDGIDGLAEVTRDGDADGDGVSNYIEYLAGTYAFDRRARFELEIVEVRDGLAHTRFLAVKGHSYTIACSTDLKEFTPTEFSLHPDGHDPISVYRAQQIRFQDVFIPAANIDAKQFRLHVK